jgi:mono/diheme cytochrome c family protein
MLLISSALLLAACANLDTAAPPVTMIAARGKDTASLESGRRIYLENCTHCHAPEAVRDHSAARWPGIIADMGGRAHLSPPQQHDVLAYVLAASQVR